VSDIAVSEKSVKRGERRRWYVHVSLLATLVGSLVTLIYLSRSITIHVIFGVLFIVFVAFHLWQRRRTVRLLAKQLVGRGRKKMSIRLAVSDTILELLVANLFVSGIVDALSHHATVLPLASAVGLPPGLDQWHKLAGIILALYVIVHVSRRWKRLRRSHIR
jgi:hypothetical protein